MRRKKKGPPPDWAPPESRWPANCTPGRDGWYRWYNGETRYICAKSVPLSEVEQCWIDKKTKIDETDPADAIPAGPVTYRDVLSDFLIREQARIGRARQGIRPRTFHNKTVALNAFGAFVFDGTKIADTPFHKIGPRHFSAYAATFGDWKASGFDSVVSRVCELFNWAKEMEYITGYKTGPDFIRPGKPSIRDDRLSRTRAWTPAEIAKLYLAANDTVRCWIAIGICAAFNNSDVANLPRTVIDRETGIIDFRRLKTGKVRRVIPLPPDVNELLWSYQRPEPIDPADADLFFLSRNGVPYSRTKTDASPSCTISRLFAKLAEGEGLKIPAKQRGDAPADGRNFGGLRTAFRNLAPRGGYDTEREIIMGHAQGTVDLDHYLEDVGLDRLRHVVNHVWALVQSEIQRLSTSPPDASASRSGETPAHAGASSSPPSSADTVARKSPGGHRTTAP